MLAELDTKFFYLINHGLQNGIFDTLMPFVTHFKNWVPVLALVLAFAAYRDWRRALQMAVVTGIAAALSDYLNSQVIKSIIARPRPCVALPDVHLLASLKHTWSFPSSHAANTACVGTCVCLYYRHAKVIAACIAVAALIGFSRIYIGVHYPMDVLAGYIIGISFAGLVFYTAKAAKTIINKPKTTSTNTLEQDS